MVVTVFVFACMLEPIVSVGQATSAYSAASPPPTSIEKPNVREAADNPDRTLSVWIIPLVAALLGGNKSTGFGMARDRIELPTRGFSVLCSTD